MSLMPQPVATHISPDPVWSSPRLQIQTDLIPDTAFSTFCLVTMDRHNPSPASVSSSVVWGDGPSLQDQGREKGIVVSTKHCLGTPFKFIRSAWGISF